MAAAFRKERSLVARFVLAKYNPRSNPSYMDSPREVRA